MHNDTIALSGFIITCVTLSFSVIGSVVSAGVLMWLAYFRIKQPTHSRGKVALLLSAYIYLLAATCMVTLASKSIHTILGDLIGWNSDSLWCKFRGYFVSALICSLYNVFVLQVSGRSI